MIEHKLRLRFEGRRWRSSRGRGCPLIETVKARHVTRLGLRLPERSAPEEANRLYEHFAARVRAAGVSTQQGVFRALMDVVLVNQGPVTILLDSRKAF